MGASLAGVGSLVGGLSGLFGGNSVPQNSNPQFNMPGMGDAAGAAFRGIQNLTPVAGATASNLIGPGEATFNNLYNNPGAAGLLSGANTASGMGTTAANNAFNLGGSLIGLGQGLTGPAQSLLQMGFDPQGALYNQTAGQLSNAVNAQNAASGISTTPYGAGVANQAMGDFNINWQNNALSRALQGAQGAGGLLTQGGNLSNLGAGIQNAAPGQYLQASGLPFGANETIGGAQNQAIGSLSNLYGTAATQLNQPVQDWMSYLQTGNQANQTANQGYGLQLQAQNQGFNQNMQLGGALGGSLYGLGQGMFGGQNPNYFAPGGNLSPFSSYINSSGDLMSAGQVTPG